MGSSSFNPQILMEKLLKLNPSQQSIETLSHWCIFHMNKAAYVVETWDRQFHCTSREQRLSLLYLANDILQNSRRKGSEFVGEFWKVLPDALRDVMEGGDENEKRAARRLIVIWDDRKVFGSRSHIFREEFIGRQPEKNNKNGYNLKPSAGKAWENLMSGYQHLHSHEVDEDVLLNNCSTAISTIQKLEKQIAGDTSSEKPHGLGYVQELRELRALLKDYTEQLFSIETSRASFLTNLREALHEQELKLDQVRTQLQAAKSQLEPAGNTGKQFVRCSNVQSEAEKKLKESSAAASVLYTRQIPVSDKSAAGVVTPKLTASAQMFTYLCSPLASDGGSNSSVKESSGDNPPEKRARIDGDQSSYQPLPPQPPSFPTFSYPQSFDHTNSVNEQPPPPPSDPPPSSPPPPPMSPLQPPMQYPPPQFMPTPGPMNGVLYNYGMTHQLIPPPLLAMPGYPHTAAPITGMSPFTPPPNNPYQKYQGSEGVFYTQPSSLPMAPHQ